MFQRGMASICSYRGFGENTVSFLLFLIKLQCFASIRLSLWASSQKYVTKTNYL